MTSIDSSRWSRTMKMDVRWDEGMRIRATLVTGTTDITAIYRGTELCFVTLYPPSSFPSLVDKSMHRQYPSTESSHPAAERPSPPLPCLSTCLPDPESHPEPRRGHDPSRNPLTLAPRDSQSTASATTSMHLYRLIWEALYAPLSAFVAPTSAYGSKGGGRGESKPDPLGWSNLNNRRALN